MAPKKIMLIRHAEKPDEKTNVLGIDEAGMPSPHQLSVRGWQRAGALVRFFAPISQTGADGIHEPGTIFAAKPANGALSLRSFNTVAPLAAALGIGINYEIGRGEECALIESVRQSATGSVLICWRHDTIADIARGIAENLQDIPSQWPKKRFDLVWVLDHGDTGWRFSQVAQFLLPGDQPPSVASASPNIVPCRAMAA